MRNQACWLQNSESLLIDRSAARLAHDNQNGFWIQRSQKFAEHDLNMQLDPGFHAVFACWLHVFSESEFWVSVHEKSSLLAAELRKSAY
jgi:hypothetical protein